MPSPRPGAGASPTAFGFFIQRDGGEKDKRESVSLDSWLNLFNNSNLNFLYLIFFFPYKDLNLFFFFF